MENVHVAEIVEQYHALSETIKGNSTSFLENLCRIDYKLDEKLRDFREWKVKLGEFRIELEPRLIGEISGYKIPLFLLIPIGFWSDRKGYRKSLMFIPIVGGIIAGLGEDNR
jgi:hypothetical protein